MRSGEKSKFWRDLEYLWVYLAASWEIKGGFHTLTDIRLTLLTQIDIFWEKLHPSPSNGRGRSRQESTESGRCVGKVSLEFGTARKVQVIQNEKSTNLKNRKRYRKEARFETLPIRFSPSSRHADTNS